MGREILSKAKDDRAVLPAALWPTRAHARLRLMRIRADKSAVCTINRHLRVPQVFDHLVEQLGQYSEGVGHECTLAALVHARSVWTQVDYR